MTSSSRRRISTVVNGEPVFIEVAPQRHLADVLRGDLGLTGTHLGCEQGVCGACNVLLDDMVVRSCLTLAIQADGRSVTTIEGLSRLGAIEDLQSAFVRRNALQCGFCTSGMLMTAYELLRTQRKLERREIREALSGNICRCTGYQAIVDAIAAIAAERATSHDTSGDVDVG